MFAALRTPGGQGTYGAYVGWGRWWRGPFFAGNYGVMLFFFLIWDIPAQLLILSPILVWFFLDRKYHPYVLVLGAAFWALLAWIVIQRMRRTASEFVETVKQGDHHWRHGQSAASFRANCQLFLQNRGWMPCAPAETAPGHVRFLVERAHEIALIHCAEGKFAPDMAFIQTLAEAGKKAGAARSYLVTAAKTVPSMRGQAFTAGVDILTYPEFESFQGKQNVIF